MKLPVHPLEAGFRAGAGSGSRKANDYRYIENDFEITLKAPDDEDDESVRFF